jgi:hypothetical protein
VSILRCEVAGCRNFPLEGPICHPCKTGETPSAWQPAPAGPERPQPQPHNLDAPGVREPLTPLEARVFKVICQGGFFTPQAASREAAEAFATWTPYVPATATL